MMQFVRMLVVTFQLAGVLLVAYPLLLLRHRAVRVSCPPHMTICASHRCF